jgi:hypothetical protein
VVAAGASDCCCCSWGCGEDEEGCDGANGEEEDLRGRGMAWARRTDAGVRAVDGRGARRGRVKAWRVGVLEAHNRETVVDIEVKTRLDAMLEVKLVEGSRMPRD